MQVLKVLAYILLVVALLVALLIDSAVWPYWLSAILIGFAVSVWRSSRAVAAIALGAASVVIITAIVLAPTEDRERRDTGVGINTGNEIVVDAEYVAHLRLKNVRDVSAKETLLLEGGPRRSFTQALRTIGWKAERRSTGERVYERSRAMRLKVADCLPCLPAEKSNRFRLPGISLLLPSHRALTIILSKDSRLILDSPTNAIGETFPAGTSGRGPGSTTRTTLPLPDRAAEWEFDVRSTLFRVSGPDKLADLTVGTVFSSLLGVIGGLLLRQIGEAIIGLFRRRRS